MIQTAALLWFAEDLVYPQSVIEKAARYSMLWIFPHTDAAGPNGPDFTSIGATVAQIRAVNPSIRIGLYVGGLVAYKAEIDPPALWLNDADLLHYPSGHPNADQPLIFHDITGIYQQGPMHYRCPNLGSPVVQDKIITGYVTLMKQYGLNGIMIDGYDHTIYAAYVANPAPAGMYNAPSGCREGSYHLPATWDPVLTQFGNRLRWRLEQDGCQLFLNGLDVEHDINIVERCSGVLNEGFWACYKAPAPAWPDEVTRFGDLIRQVQAVAARRRHIFLLASIGGYRLNDPATTVLDSLALQRFYLGTYLQVQEPPYTSLGYHPHAPYRAWDGWSANQSGNPYVFWSDDWEVDYGYPLAPATPIVSIEGSPTAVWARWYQSPSGQCLVLVNPSGTNQLAITGPGVFNNPWHDVNEPAILDQGPQAPLYRMWMAPRTARVLFRVAT